MNESNGHEQEKYVLLVDSQRGQPSFESASHHEVWQWESRMGLQVVWSTERKYAPGSFVPSCCSRKCTIIRIERRRFIVYAGVHSAVQGRQQRIVCVKDYKMNELQRTAVDLFKQSGTAR